MKLKYKTLTIEKNFHDSLEDRFLMVKIGGVVDVEEGQDEFEISKQAYQDLHTIHKLNRPDLYQPPIQIREKIPTELPIVQSEPPTAPLSKEERIDRQRQVIIAEINACTSPESLLSYRLISGKHEEVQKAYDIKFESFKK